MAKEESKSRVEELKDTLNSRTQYQDPEDTRTPVEAEDVPNVEEKWDSPDLDEMLKYDRRKPEEHPLMKKIFIFAAGFFIAAVAVASYMFLGEPALFLPRMSTSASLDQFLHLLEMFWSSA